jgi:hypothetical protein
VEEEESKVCMMEGKVLDEILVKLQNCFWEFTTNSCNPRYTMPYTLHVTPKTPSKDTWPVPGVSGW